METPLAVNRSVDDSPPSAYDYVGGQITALIECFELHDQRALIMQTYADLCGDSLAYPYGVHPPTHSRINHDGTPIQYAVTLGSANHTLQFLSEAGGPGVTGAARMRANRACSATLAERFHASEPLAAVSPLLDVLAPATNVDLLADAGGAYWEGVAFSLAQTPALRIYVNARWGKEQDRWARLSRFAAHFGASVPWAEIAGRLAPDLQPLGVAITLHGDQPPDGRIYLSTYGKHMPYYEALAEVYGGPDFMRRLRSFGRCVLGDDYVYPTQTAVCSFGFGDGPTPDFKFELCAHCLFISDAEASTGLRTWFEVAHLDATDYWDMLDVLSHGHLSDAAPVLHCYVGMGLRRGAPYATVYLKPQLNAS